MHPPLIAEIEKILKVKLHPAPERGSDPVSGVMPVKENGIFRFALRDGELAGLNLAGVGLTDEQWARICTLEGFKSERIEALNLRDNKLKKIKLPSSMTHLRQIDLCNNQIEAFLMPPEGSAHLQHIWLYNNPQLSNPSPELVQQGNSALVQFFRALSKGSEKIREAKLLVLGEGGAGKTTLARKILKGFSEPLPVEKDTTHGIEINDLGFSGSNGKDFTMHVWDFGGQEIYHATHQFFLTKRSLYVLVADVRTENTKFNYWLQVIELLSEKSPVLILLNRKGGRSMEIDEAGLRGRFKNLKDVISLDLSTDKDHFDQLLREICHQIQSLKHVDGDWPASWAEVRRSLEALKQSGEQDITIETYFGICEKEGLNEDEALILSQFLHDFGVFLHFQEDVLLKRTVFLNNDWVTKGVYTVLDDPKVIESKGYFSMEDAKKIWGTEAYRRRSDELLHLMNKFELCYQLDNAATAQRFLVPHLLSISKPSLDWDDKDNLQLRYHYDFMPKGLLARLIVRLHRYLPSDPSGIVWRAGAIFQRQGAKAKLEETYTTRNLFLRATGREAKALVTVISEEIDHLNKGYHGLKVQKLVPCNCRICRDLDEPNFYEYDDLIRRKDRGKTTVECKNSYDDVPVLRLIDDVFVTTFFTEQPKKIFISYSKADESYLEALKKVLAPLKRQELIKTWDDTDLGPGEEWDAAIRRELNAADIIILLVSNDLMSTDYVWDIEMKEAIERHERGQAVVLPVIIRPSLWEDAPFSKLNALPTKGKAISTWSNPDEAWKEVATKIKQITQRKKI